MIGKVIAEFKGKTTGIRVLSEGKVEASEQGSGSILGIEASILATAVSTPMPNGVTMGEGDALVTTIDGDVVMVRKSGIGWSTGKGRKASKRGVFFHLTKAQKLARLNKVVGMYEYESDEKGDWTAKIWEWK
jgi:hypothetical protein